MPVVNRRVWRDNAIDTRIASNDGVLVGWICLRCVGGRLGEAAANGPSQGLNWALTSDVNALVGATS